jgi:hypothetical protein
MDIDTDDSFDTYENIFLNNFSWRIIPMYKENDIYIYTKNIQIMFMQYFKMTSLL